MHRIDYGKSVQQIPGIIKRILLGEQTRFPEFGDLRCNRVIFILVDSLGYNLFTHYLWEMNKRGSTMKIYSVFPSTTAAAITSIYTGLSPKEHGILEWYMYYEEFGNIIKTLPLSTRDGDVNDELIKKGLATDSIFKLPALTSYLKEKDLNSYAFVSEKYAFSSYSRHMFASAKIVPYKSYIDGFQLLKSVDDYNLAIIYIDTVDILSHKYAPSSTQVYLEIMRIKREIQKKMEDVKDTVIILTADHGHVDLRRVKIRKELLCNENILPGGSPRDVFLYCDTPPYIDDGILLSREEVLKNGLIGEGKEHPHLNERLPNYILLATKNEGIWFEKIEMRGAHGGLSRTEIEVPLFIAEL